MQMFKVFLSLFLCMLISFTHAQTTLSDAVLKNMQSRLVTFSSITKNDSTILICFWSVGSAISMDELNAIGARLPKWKESASFKFLAIAIDNGDEANKVRPLARANGWYSDFEVYIDINNNLRDALHLGSLPQSVIIRHGKVFYQQAGYKKGTEEYLFKKIMEKG
jgi:cytochrome c biogenesis protein CcmG/thiol:disulfide interchange protein DsbE